MKTVKTICFLLACLLTISASASRIKYDSLSCLQVEGKIVNAKDGMAPCRIELWRNNKIIDTLILHNGHGKFKFVLQKNSYYTIRITKEGFADRLVCVNTDIAFEPDGIERFRFSTALIDEESAYRLNHDALDFPVAIIQYQEKSEEFIYNKEYTAKIKRELYSPTPDNSISNK